MNPRSAKYSLTCCLLIITAAPACCFAQTKTPPTPVDLPKDMKAVFTTADRASEDLKAHGIGLEEKELIGFLENGLSKTTNLPDRPLEKSQLIIDTLSKLSTMRSRAAVPVIMKIASFDRTVGCFKVIEYDVSKTTAQSREDFRVRAYRLIQFNAINALSLIGDPQAADIVRTVLTQEQSAGAQIQYAICLASLGDASGVDYLVNLINLKNRKESAAAAKAYYFITGQDFGYTEDSPVRARAALAPRYVEWWRQNRPYFKVDSEAVRERRLKGPQQQVSAPRSTRDLLKMAANYFDFNNTMGSAEARKTLNAAGSSLNQDLKRVAEDPMEDLDVRMEALNWYFEANRRSSNSDPLDVYKSLRKDENPEISDKIRTLQSQLVEDKALEQLGKR